MKKGLHINLILERVGLNPLRMHSLCCVLAVVTFMLSTPSRTYALTESDHEGGASEQTEAPSSKVSIKGFPGFGTVARGLKDACAAMRDDGRERLFYDVALRHLEKDPRCMVCYMWNRQVYISCAPPKDPAAIKKKNKKSDAPAEGEAEQIEASENPEETPTPLPRVFRQRDPNARVQVYLSQVAREIINDNRRRDGGFDAIRNFLSLLREEARENQSEIDYVETVASYLEQAIAEYEAEQREHAVEIEVIDEKASKNSKKRSKEMTKEEFDALFGK